MTYAETKKNKVRVEIGYTDYLTSASYIEEIETIEKAASGKIAGGGF